MNRLSLVIAIAVSLPAVTSCRSHKSVPLRASGSAPVTVVRPVGDPGVMASDKSMNVDSRVGERLVSHARSWIGTPYRYGGADRKGTDCSGMLMTIFEEVAGLKLPRNSAAQRGYCLDVAKKGLQPGDLVFFSSSAGGGKVNHVGLYTGSGRFIHASTSRGVIESRLDEKYYESHYHSSGRVYGITCAATGGKDKEKESKSKSKTKSASASKQKSEPSSMPAAAKPTPAPAVASQTVVEMTLDEFVARQQPKPAVADSIPAQCEENVSVKTDTIPAEPDSVRRSEAIRSGVVKAMNFGK